MGGEQFQDAALDVVKVGRRPRLARKPHLHLAHGHLICPGGDTAAGQRVVDGRRGEAVPTDAQQGGQRLASGAVQRGGIGCFGT